MIVIPGGNKVIKPHATSDFWDFGDHRENPIHRIHSYPAKFPAFITTKALRYAEKKGVSVNYNRRSMLRMWYYRSRSEKNRQELLGLRH